MVAVGLDRLDTFFHGKDLICYFDIQLKIIVSSFINLNVVQKKQIKRHSITV